MANYGRMKTYIALLRGINVIGRNPLPMTELVALLAEAGARNISTNIRSGNAVFQYAQRSTSKLSAQLRDEIRKRHGFSPLVIILGTGTMERAIAQNPFPEAESDPRSLHLGFFASTPESPDLKKLDALKKASERFYLSAQVFYLYTPEGVEKSKLPANAGKSLGVPVTFRNWSTVCKIRDMAEKIRE
jgi:uncharacterized protein (DUF1697 family)